MFLYFFFCLYNIIIFNIEKRSIPSIVYSIICCFIISFGSVVRSIQFLLYYCCSRYSSNVPSNWRERERENNGYCYSNIETLIIIYVAYFVVAVVVVVLWWQVLEKPNCRRLCQLVIHSANKYVQSIVG